jgi:phage terminase large subunit GpA-like protein
MQLFLGLPVGDNGESWDLSLSPWVKAVFDWWLDPSVEWIYLIQGSQTSKTTTEMGLLLYAAKYDPGPAMWVSAVEEEADKFCVQRLKPFLEAADSSVKTGRKTDWRSSDLRLFGKMLMHLAWATSGTRLRSWPCRYVFGDECGIWPSALPTIGNPLAYVKKRTRRFKRRKGIFATTPSNETHPAWVAAKSANFARWLVPCPECGHFQYLDFHNGLKFRHCKTQDGWDRARLASETYYECSECAARLTDQHKAKMVSAGRLEYVDPDSGKPKPLDKSNTSRTLQVPSTYSLFTTWPQMAGMFLDAVDEGPDTLRIFVTDELAEPWKEKTEAPEMDALRKCIDPERHSGSLPDGAWVITAGVDIQLHSIYYVIRAWGANQRSWLLQYGMIPREEHSIAMLDEIRCADFGGMPIAMMFIDSGKWPDLVYDYCMRAQPRNCAPCKGTRPSAQPVQVSNLDKNSKGHSIAGGMKLYLCNSSHWKGTVHDRIGTRRGDPGEWRLPCDIPEEYLQGILAESRKPRKHGSMVVDEWVLTGKFNHPLDCEAYAAAAAWFPVQVRRMTAPLIYRTQQEPARPAQAVAGGRGPIRRSY